MWERERKKTISFLLSSINQWRRGVLRQTILTYVYGSSAAGAEKNQQVENEAARSRVVHYRAGNSAVSRRGWSSDGSGSPRTFGHRALITASAKEQWKKNPWNIWKKKRKFILTLCLLINFTNIFILGNMFSIFEDIYRNWEIKV